MYYNLDFLSYQIALGLSIRWWPRLAIRIYVGPWKLYAGLKEKPDG